MEVMSPWKSKMIPLTRLPQRSRSSGIRREGMQGREPGAPSGLRGRETAPEKASATSWEKQGVKNPGPSSAVWKAEDEALFSFEEFLLLPGPIPRRGVTGGHGSSVRTGNFLLPSVIPDAPNKRERGTSAENWLGKGFWSLESLFFPPIFSILSLNSLFRTRVALAIPRSWK